jgi:perosamine synthetase
MRFVAPTGVPLKMSDLVQSVTVGNGQGKEALAAVAARLRVRHIFGASSGRAALWLALKALHRLRPDRDAVAIPAYSCFSVPAAVVRAGLKIHPVEVNPSTLDFDPQQLDALPETTLLCIIPCNLFGFPNDISKIRDAARARGAYVIDDAAQALGSTCDGRRAGTLGDVGVYSLGRGKSVGSVAGGLLVTDSHDIAAMIQSEAKVLTKATRATGGELLFRMLSYSLFLHPRLFWIPNSLPFLKLGTTEFEPSFVIGQMHPFSVALLEPLLDDLEEINHGRQKKARAITDALRDRRNFAFPSPGANSQPTFVRLPVLACDYATRNRAVARLRDAGIGATSFYPSAICDIPSIENYICERDFHCPQAEELSRRLFTLPVHPFVRPTDIERIVEILAAL